MPTVGQFPIHIGNTIVEVDTLTITVVAVYFPQLRFEVVAISQSDFLSAVREINSVPHEPT